MRGVSKFAKGLLQLSVEGGGVSDVNPDWFSFVLDVSHCVSCFAVPSRKNFYVVNLTTQSEISGFVTENLQ